MARTTHGFPARAAIVMLVVAWATTVAMAAGKTSGAAPAAPAPTPAVATPATPAPAAQTPASGYAGSDTCAVCHEDEANGIRSTLHGQAVNPRTPFADRGCETCHGPGQAHVDSGGDVNQIVRFTTMAARDISDKCLSCHEDTGHAEFKGGMHDARNLSCTTCHSVHHPKSEHAQLKTATVIETCVTCHKTEVNKLQRSGHMPVREGKMDCVTCHNPHGSTNIRMLRVGNWVTDFCVSCHTEKRGPFLWEHAAGREGCNTCHDPHGSNNERMLVAKLPMLCQRCHIGSRHPSTIYDGIQVAGRSSRIIGRACVQCHAQIHGSNSPAGNTFLR
jgi:DmsE family decaheme c-type cytochrome